MTGDCSLHRIEPDNKCVVHRLGAKNNHCICATIILCIVTALSLSWVCCCHIIVFVVFVAVTSLLFLFLLMSYHCVFVDAVLFSFLLCCRC